MPTSVRLAALVTASAALLEPRFALAQWAKVVAGSPSSYLASVSTPDGVHVFAAGSLIDTSGSFPTEYPRVYASADSGETYTDISGPLGTQSGLNNTTALGFADAQHGWVSVGNAIEHTANGGTSWSSTNVGASMNAIQAFDAEHVVCVGVGGAASYTSNGGQTWTAADASSVSGDFQRMFWLDAEHGWASVQLTDGNSIVQQAGVARTTDGGHTWTQTWSTSTVGVGSLFFLADGLTGWLATYQQTDMTGNPPDPNIALAQLLHTTDGGLTFTPVPLPTMVGTITTIGITNPIQTARLFGMFWANSQQGHVVGGAYLGSSTSSMSGGMTSTSQTTGYWKLIDYVTSDGGSTWTHTSLGALQGSLTSPPPSDGTFYDGVFSDLDNGWLSAGSGEVWSDSAACKSDSSCLDGYTCADGRCTSPGGGGGGGFKQGGTGTVGTDGGTGSGGDAAKPGCACDGLSSGGGLSAAMIWALRRRRRCQS